MTVPGPALALIVAALLAAGTAVAWRAGDPASDLRNPATPVRVLVLGFLVLYGAGAVILAASGESSGGALLVGAALPAIAVGAWVGGRAGRRPIEVGAAERRQAATQPAPRWWVAGLLAAAGLAAYASLAAAHGIPLIDADPQASRAGFAGLRWDAFRWLVPPGALLPVAAALAAGGRLRWVAAGVALAAVLGLEVLAASRALPFELLLAIILVAWWAGRRFGARAWVAIGLAASVLFLGVLFARIGPDGSFRDPLDAATFAFNRTIGRIVLIQQRTIDAAVAVFPAEEPYQAGATYVRWLAPLRGEQPVPSLGSLLFARLFPGEPPGGFAAPGLLGEGYANFGAAVALALMAALGAAAALLGRWTARWPADPATRALAALLVVAILRTYATSLNGFLLTVAAAGGWWLLVRAGPGTVRSPSSWRGRRTDGVTRPRSGPG